MIRFLERAIFPLFLITAIVGLVYWYWTTTPTYALTQIVSSIKNRDTETFERYVDIESIVSKGIDDLIHGPARQAGLFGNFDKYVGVGIISLFKPELAEIARTQVLKFIAAGSLSADAPKPKPVDPEDKPGAIAGMFKQSEEQKSTSFGRFSKSDKVKRQLKDYGLSKDGFKGVDYLKNEGKVALVGLKFFSPKLDRYYFIELKMEDTGGTWRITSISNLDELVKFYLETKDEIDQEQDETSFEFKAHAPPAA